MYEYIIDAVTCRYYARMRVLENLKFREIFSFKYPKLQRIRWGNLNGEKIWIIVSIC